MGEAADLLAAEYGDYRGACQDAYASRSHARAIAARASGAFAAELVPQPGLDHDERPRDGFTPNVSRGFGPVFRPHGTVTAANAAGDDWRWRASSWWTPPRTTPCVRAVLPSPGCASWAS